MKYGQLPATKFTERNGIKLNEWVKVDMTPASLKKHGYRPKRGWCDIVEFKVTHIFDDYFVGLTGSLNNMCLPFNLVVK